MRRRLASAALGGISAHRGGLGALIISASSQLGGGGSMALAHRSASAFSASLKWRRIFGVGARRGGGVMAQTSASLGIVGSSAAAALSRGGVMAGKWRRSRRKQ